MDLFRTTQIRGAAVMAITNLDTDARFPTRTAPVTFRTAIRITENSDVHKGLVFEFGSDAIGVALWVGDQTIGCTAGEDGAINGATVTFDNGTPWPTGLELDVVVSVRPGDGQIRLWLNGTAFPDTIEF